MILYQNSDDAATARAAALAAWNKKREEDGDPPDDIVKKPQARPTLTIPGPAASDAKKKPKVVLMY